MIGGAYIYRSLSDNHPSSRLTGTWFDQFPDGEIEVRSAIYEQPAHFTLDTDTHLIWLMAAEHRHRNPRWHFFPNYEEEDIARQLAAADNQHRGPYMAAAVCRYSLAYHAGVAFPTSQAMARISPEVGHMEPDLPPKRRGTPLPLPSPDAPVRELHALALNRPEPIHPDDRIYAMGPDSQRVSLAAMAMLHVVQSLPPPTILQHAYRLRDEYTSSFPQPLAEAAGFGNSAHNERTPEGEFVIGRAIVGSAEQEGSIVYTLYEYFDKHNISVTELPPTL